MVVTIKKILAVIVVLVLIAGSGCLYVKNSLLNPKSEMDTKSPEQQKEELLKNDKYKGLPEVEALKEQEKQQQKQQINKDNIKPVSTKNKKHSNEASKKSEKSSKTEPQKTEQPKPNQKQEENIPSKAQLENQLKEKLNSLQAEYNTKLNQLLASAKAEYKQVQSGEKEASVSKLAKKYLSLGNAMEAECDARVYAAIAFTENELKQYNYNTSIITEARETYKQTKEERRNRMLDRFINYI